MSTRWFTLALLVAACGGEPITVGATRGTGPTPSGGTGTPPAAPAPEAAAAAEEAAPPTPLTYTDDDFVETERNRDPFRSYAQLFVPTAEEAARPERDVIMPDVPLEEMRLIAIISGVASPSAMIEDASGTGFTVHRGDFLGREDVVNAGGTSGLPLTLNWRVDRIHADAVILTRDDPTTPDRVPLTRVIPLHAEVSGG